MNNKDCNIKRYLHFRTYIYLLIIVLFVSSCASKNWVESFLREDVDLSYISKIIILPFENNTQDKFIAEHARSIVTTNILSLQLFDVVDKSMVDSVLIEEGYKEGNPMDQATLNRIGQRLDAQGVFMGSVDLVNENRVGSTTTEEITLTLRLLDAENTTLLWQATGHGNNSSPWVRLFGVTPQDSFEVLMTLTKNLLSSVPQPSQEAPAIEMMLEKDSNGEE